MKPSSSTDDPKNLFREIYKKPEPGKKRGSFFAGVARFVVLVFLACAAGGAGIAAQGYLYFTQNLPSIEKLKKYSPWTVSQFYDDKSNLISEFSSERRYVMPYDQIPKILQDAFVAAEDKNFWSHGGVDKEAILRAIRRNLEMGSGSRQGASTITQQLVKTLFLTPERTFTRKIKEAILSTRVERAFSKEYILYLYLNQVYFGSGAYGVEAAARVYFDKSIKDLTIAECALLAGLMKAPSASSPRNNMKRALERRAYVLDRMLKDGYITEAQFEAAGKEEPVLGSKYGQYPKAAADFTEHVRRYVEKKYGAEALYKEGLHVYTSVDMEATKIAHEAIENGLRELDKREGYRGPSKTLTGKEITNFLEEKSRSLEAPLKFGQVTSAVITHLDNENIYVLMGTYDNGKIKKEYVGHIKVDPDHKWWARSPFVRPELRTRNFAQGDLPFQVGDLIQVRLVDPNFKRRDLYMKKYGKNDPEMANYKEYSEEMVSNFPLELEQEPIVQSALMFRENKTGYVKVLLGGYSNAESKYNRATQARRQAGSSFKPVIYAAALNKGFTPADIILDSPYVLTVPSTGEVWRPKNYRGGFAGPVTLRDCLVKSRNIPTIKILQQIGIDYAKSYAKKLGYVSPLVDNLTLALGSTGVSLEEQLNVYSVFPNKGYAVPNIYVTKIVDRNGKVLEEHHPPALLDGPGFEIKKASHETSVREFVDENSDRGTQLVQRKLDEATAYIMTTMLQGVIQEGTATNLKKIMGRSDVAGKTGTTNENVDAWFVGFSPDYTCGVWVGFDDEHSIGEGETGGKAAAPIWGYFMREMMKSKPVREFPVPKSVEFRKIDPRTGLMTSNAGSVLEVFKSGSGPSSEAEPKLIKGSRWDYAGSDLDQF